MTAYKLTKPFSLSGELSNKTIQSEGSPQDLKPPLASRRVFRSRARLKAWLLRFENAALSLCALARLVRGIFTTTVVPLQDLCR